MKFPYHQKEQKTNAPNTFLGEILVNLICDYVRIPKVRLRMSTETFQRAILDYSEDGRQIVQNVSPANINRFLYNNMKSLPQFVNNNSTIDAVKGVTESVYRALLRSIQKLKEITVQLSNPQPLFDQLRVLLRDESKDILLVKISVP